MKKILTLMLSCTSVSFAIAQNQTNIQVFPDSTFNALHQLSKSSLAGGDIMLFTTTHQDLGWLDRIENCIIKRDTLWLTPFIKRLDNEPDFKMDIEQASIVKEYIHRHPEMKEKINKYLHEGRICIGGTYIQPYEEMYGSEALARQFYFGSRWLKKTFDGYKALSYFNVDVPGRTLQMPQIMKKAGIDNLVISRHERGLFNWESPDGSKVRTYSPGHYIYFYNVLGKNDQDAIDEMSQEAVLWYTKFNNVKKTRGVMPAMLNYEFTWDQRNVENCIPFISKWNCIEYIQNDKGKKIKVNLPKFKYAIADDFYNALDKSTIEIPSYKGERPNVWLYIHGPTHEEALTASRKGDILLPAAEKLASFDFFVNKNFNNYNQKRFNNAWEAKIYPDHGWNGNNGVETDNTFLRKFEFALTEASAMSEQYIQRLASNVKTDLSKGRPIVTFNSLSWQRKVPVEVEIQFEKGYAKSLTVMDHKQQQCSFQLSDVEYYEDKSICSATLHFIATDLPALGLKTFYVKPSNDLISVQETKNSSIIENEFYKIDLVNGGIKQIYDKDQAANLLNTSKFLGGEIITLKSEGNGAGEFDAVQQPSMDGFDKISNHKSQWKIKEDGKVYTTYTYRSPIRNAVIEQTLRVYHQVKKIDIDVSILNWEGILYREYRMMLPLAMNDSRVSYEIPYGSLTVGEDEMPGAAGERYYEENNKQHPRGINNWLSATGNDLSVTLSSSVAVADYIDPTDNSVDYPILQPILLASRRSCHPQGTEYLQVGDHHYRFSITSHEIDDNKKAKLGVSANEKPFAVYNPQSFTHATLPESYSFFNVENDNVVVTTIKKCEDDNSLIIRLYNRSGAEQEVPFEASIMPNKIIKTNLIEEELQEVDKITLGKYAIETYKFKY